ncbi:hypothetical protein SK128_028557 [Halocaridina rubra]|uniref:Uncharacterized protein n=1 Tax=Halocaridina rubra TaxID=373956 RepID=A0AAN8W991_HALRR
MKKSTPLATPKACHNKEDITNSQSNTRCKKFHTSARIKISELQDQERHMTEVLIAYDSAISSGDASSLSESSLREVTPTFQDPTYLQIGSPTPSPKEPVPEPLSPQQNGLPAQETTNTPKAKDTSFVGGHDPFASAFGNQQNNVDVFGSWDQNPSNPVSNPAPASGDPFGGDAFASQTKGANDPFGSEPFTAGGGGPPPRPESPTPALPPKKAKQPPPRPAPPKTRPAKPPPPQINSNNNPSKNINTNSNANTNTNPSTGDPFGGGWGDSKVANTNNGGFADFANFADFDTKFE